MVNILISGYYGFDNIGDESILRTLVSSLREHIPDCSLTVLSHNPASTREKYGVEAVDRMSPVAILRAVKKCDMLISGGGSLLQDVTSSKSLHYYLSIIRCAEFFHKKVFSYSQGSGPIDRPGNRRAAAAALTGTKAVLGYAPALLIFSLITGTVTGTVLRIVMPALEKQTRFIIKNQQYNHKELKKCARLN